MLFSSETKHLFYWWLVWLTRLVRTTYHIVNRSAYRKWKRHRYNYRYAEPCDFIIGEHDL